MTKSVKTPASVTAPQDGRLPQFLRIEREAADRLLEATKRHPQARPQSNGRVVQFARIERGREA
ncbi:MAG: hypothetical protein ACRC6I_12200 [Paracoccaceae bacterium]